MFKRLIYYLKPDIIRKGMSYLKNVRKVLCLCFVIVAVFLAGTVYAQRTVRVYVNGMRVEEETLLHNDRTFIPLRAVSEALGAEVTWDGDTYSAFINFTEDDAIAKVVETVSPSVVTIIGNAISNSASAQYNTPTAHGSGVIYKSNGHILTNAHVVQGIKNITVVLNNGESYPAKVLYSDELADIAIVKIEKLGLTPISFADPATVISGKTVIAIGTPISLSMRNSVTKGIISGVDVSLEGSHYKILQTDASINPGNSGGPLLNVRGELVGLNSSKYASVMIDNMSFSIPVETLKFAISQFETYGGIIRPAIDFTLEQSWEAKIGLPTSKGLTVRSSTDASILAGDVITALGGIEVHSISDWNEAVKKTYNPSTKALDISYIRNGMVSSTTIYK